jgi:hypothetical protein
MNLDTTLFEMRDEAALPRRLNGAWIVVLPNIVDSFIIGYSINYSETG